MRISSRLLTGTLFLCTLTLVSCNNNKQPTANGDAASMPEPVQEYPVIQLTTSSTTLYNDYPANIQGQQIIEIRPKIEGYVEAIYVDEGATVKKGQPLFRINAPQYEQEVRTAQADIKIAQAEVNAAKMQVEKVRPLVEQDIISKYELQSAEYTLQSKMAALAQSEARLANARTNLGYTNVTSPVNGIIGSLPYKLGSLVNGNTPQPLTTVANVGNIYAYFSFNEKQTLQFNRNNSGNTIQQRLASIPPVTLILSDGTEYPAPGKIETASGLINTQTGSINVRATFTNPGNFILSGSTGKIRIPETIDSALLIPQKSTYEIQGKRFAYKLAADSTISSTEIKVQEGSNGQFFVILEGLKAGDKIVSDGVGSLRDGLKIKPKAITADSLSAAGK